MSRNEPSRNGTHPQPEYEKNEVDIKLDRITDLWLKLERKLLKEQPPRRITSSYFTRLHMDDGSAVVERRYLGIQRLGGKWRICYAETWSEEAENVEEIPWKAIAECNVDTRTQAVEGIPGLKYEVKKTRTEFIPALDAAIDTLETALLDEGDEH